MAFRESPAIVPNVERGRRLSGALAGALAVAAIGSVWILGRDTPLSLDGDAEMLLHPLLVDAARQVRDGRLPLWTAGRWGGSPLLADPILGMLYPPYYVGYLLTSFPHSRALDVSTCLHLVVLATGVAVLMRRLGAGALVAAATAVALATAPPLVYAARGWQQYWAALSYWPWLYWAAVTLVDSRRILPALVASVAIAAQVYAGYPEFALYSGIPALAWVVVAPGGRRRIALVLAIGLGAIALAMPQLLPGLEMARESLRLQELAGASMHPLDRFFSVSGEQWWNAVRTEPPLSVGSPVKIAPAALVLAAVGAFSRGFAPRYLACIAVTLAVLATRDNPIYRVVRVVPPFSFFGAPLKLMYPLSFVVVVLAGLGLARLETLPVAWRRVAVVVVGVAAALSWGAGTLATLALVAVGGVAALVPAPQLGTAAAVLAAAGSVAFLDATRAVVTPTPFKPPHLIELVRRPPPVAPRPDGRMLALLPSHSFWQAGLNYGALWDVPSWNGMADLTQLRQVKVIESATPANLAAAARQMGADPAVVVGGSRPGTELVAAGWVEVGRLDPLVFLAAPAPPLPRAQLAPRAKAATRDDAIAAARLGRALGGGRVLIETDRLRGGAVGDAAGRVERVAHATGRVEARVTVARPTWLVFREPFYRNWHATVGGQPADVVPAGGFLMAVLVGAGTHEVRVEYREPGLWLGLAIAGLAAIVLPLVLRRAVRQP